MYGMYGIGNTSVERLKMCIDKPVPHLCNSKGYCPYTRLIRHGLVEHVGAGYYAATEKGALFINTLDT